jgi:hypothetical protein
VDAWHIPKKCQEALESWCWSHIIAPPGIAPSTKRPFTFKGSMNCSEWITFTKVTGKYLFSQVFKGAHLGVLCDLLDFVSDCLDHELTPDKIDVLKARARKVAGHIEQYFPPSEQSLVLHHMIFHIPRQLQIWGPARCTWVFWAERSVSDRWVCVLASLLIFAYNLLPFVTICYGFYAQRYRSLRSLHQKS